jgi:hypothetical protein
MHVRIQNVLITQKNQKAYLFAVIVGFLAFLIIAAMRVELMAIELLQIRKHNNPN